MSRGIDYGLGQTNIDRTTGIRFGVIPVNEVCQAWYDSSEADYGPATCGECGTELTTDHDFIGAEYACPSCERPIEDREDMYGDEPICHTLDDGEYLATDDSQGDIFIERSPYYTRAQFCSPCAPGACHLSNPTEKGERAYCFGHDWFEDGIAPYPVYSVATGELVNPT